MELNNVNELIFDIDSSNKLEEIKFKTEEVKSEKELLDIKKKNIINTVNKFGKSEHLEILKIIQKYEDIKYTENSNGIFINLNTIPESVLLEIEKFVTYYIIKKDYLKQEKTKQENIKKIIKNNIEKKCDLKINEMKKEKNDEEIKYYNELRDIDQNEMYYQESNFSLPKINYKN